MTMKSILIGILVMSLLLYVLDLLFSLTGISQWSQGFWCASILSGGYYAFKKDKK